MRALRPGISHIAAFSHCPDTIYEVCNAGGLGILGLQGMGMGAGASGAQNKDPAEELSQALRLITSKTSRPFGIDLLLPTELPVGIREMTGADVLNMIPEEHKQMDYVEGALEAMEKFQFE